MKKILLLFVAVATLVFVGCSKDDEKGSAELVGTEWECVENGAYDLITFTSESEFSWYGYEDDFEDRFEMSGEGNYIYIPPKITMVQDGVTTVGYITGDTMPLGEKIYVKKK